MKSRFHIRYWGSFPDRVVLVINPQEDEENEENDDDKDVSYDLLQYLLASEFKPIFTSSGRDASEICELISKTKGVRCRQGGNQNVQEALSEIEEVNEFFKDAEKWNQSDFLQYTKLFAYSTQSFVKETRTSASWVMSDKWRCKKLQKVCVELRIAVENCKKIFHNGFTGENMQHVRDGYEHVRWCVLELMVVCYMSNE